MAEFLLASFNAYQVANKTNLIPVNFTLDREYLQLKIEKFPALVSEPTSPIWRRISWNRKRLSRKSSSYAKSNPTPSVEIIELSEIKEIRLLSELEQLKKQNDYNKGLKELKNKAGSSKKQHNLSQYKFFDILYGREFNLIKQGFVAESRQGILDSWIGEIRSIQQVSLSIKYFSHLDLWYRKHFDLALARSTDNFRLKIYKQFLNRAHRRILTEDLRALLPTQYFSRGLGSLEKDEFETMARFLVHSPQTIATIFEPFTGQNLDHFVVPIELEDMFKGYFKYVLEHGEFLPEIGSSLDDASQMTKILIRQIAQHFKVTNEIEFVKEKWLCSYYILDYMFSEDNSVWDPKYDQIYQDMDYPLPYYWVYSSHNSYLTGDQYSSPSSAETYARVLRQGCRCIEIDIWDGPGGKPVVKHGHTMTTKVPLIDVLYAIRDNAFVTSCYPVIISIENHCNMNQQKKMARYFRRVFGKTLVTCPLELSDACSSSTSSSPGRITTLPSPNQLKNRIILKGRKLPDDLTRKPSTENNTTTTMGLAVNDNQPDTAMPTPRKSINVSSTDSLFNGIDDYPPGGEDKSCDCLMSGELWKKTADKPGTGTWVKCVFVLTNKKLFFVEKEPEDDNPYLSRFDSYRYSVTSVESNQDLHVDQVWYHGKVPGGRVVAAEMLTQCGINGCFLVRESDTQKNGFSLSFFCNGKVYHCHIYSPEVPTNDKMYSLKDSGEGEETMFTSIYELVEYYRRHPLVTKNDCQLDHLGDPVPPSKTHETQEWFYKEMDRAEAERVLEKLPINGAFLGRYSTRNRNQIVISFVLDLAGTLIKHCDIKAEGRYLTVSNLKFVKLEALVEHYGKYAFYKDVKLSHPIGNELYRQSQQNDCVQRVYACPEYLNSTVKTVKGRVKAIQSYVTSDPELLSFKRGDIIINVVKEASGWWWGTLPDMPDDPPKQFCASFVEEIEELDCPFGESCKGTWELGSDVKVKCCKDKDAKKNHGIDYLIQFKYHDGTKKPLGAACSKRRAEEWVEHLKYVVDQDEETRKKWEKMQASARYKIAPEYSDLIIYCSGLDRLNPKEIGRNKDNIVVTGVKSFDEISGDRLFRSHPVYFVWYHQHAMTRIYPRGIRLDSSNFSPARFWNFGCQMVALNFQTADKPMQWNRGKFRQNGNCGYVLKPEFMISETQDSIKSLFDPTLLNIEESTKQPMYLNIQVIAARHLEKTTSGPISPLVEIEVVGIDADCRRFKTRTDETTIGNGLNPHWNFIVSIPILCPELALIQFSVCDEDTFNDRNLLGECTIPVNCMREGYRSIQLRNAYGEPLLSTLLVKISKENSN